MPQFLTIEQKVECLAEATGETRRQLQQFLAVTDAALDSGLLEARRIIEYFVGQILHQEQISGDRDLINNIEILGGKDGKFPARRRKDPGGPIPPPVLSPPIYSLLQNVRIYGNLVAHSRDPETMELKDVRLTSADFQVALSLIMRLIEWYFQEYARGPHIDPLYDRLPEPIVARYGEAPPDPAQFLGRTAELEALREVFDHGPAKLVQVLAPAGMGKTFLTARAALDVARRWQNGQGMLLWFDLKAAPSFGEISARILASFLPDAAPTDVAIGQLSPGARIGQIVRRMAETPSLLVLDNFESWLDPANRRPQDSYVTQFLEQCAARSHRGRVVLTSRTEVELSGLPAAAVATQYVRSLPQADARELLLRQGVTGSERAITDVCQRLSGNPRLLIMLTEVLLKRRCGDLDQGLTRYPGLVTEKADDLLAEVWGELSLVGRLALQTLAVLRPPAFASDLAAVSAILDPAADDVEEVFWNELVPRSLVVPNNDGSAFTFEHLLIRDYSLRQWRDPVVAHRAALRHFQQVVAGELPGDGPHPARLSAIYHALACGDFAYAAQVVTNESFKHSMQRHGRHIEMLELCRPIVAAADRLDPLLRIHVRRLAGTLLDCIGDYPAALKLHEACRDELGQWRRSEEECRTLTELCSVMRKIQRYDEAEIAGQQALTIARTQGLQQSEALALFELASVSRNRGQPRDAAKRARAGFEVAERFGEPMPRIMARIAMAQPMVGGCSLGQPQRLFQEALVLCRTLGHVRTEAQLLRSLADIARRQNRIDEAMQLVNEAIEIFQRIGDRTGEGIARKCRGLALCQLGKARINEGLSELRRALRLAIDLEHPRELCGVLLALSGVLANPRTAAAAVACARVAHDLHSRMGHKRWKKALRFIDDFRGQLEHQGFDWQQLEQTVASERIALLEQATQIDRETWQRLLAERFAPNSEPDGPPV